MGFLLKVGKLVLILALCTQAYFLLANVEEKNNFSSKLKKLTAHQLFKPLAPLATHTFTLRIAISALLSLSVFGLIWNSNLVAFAAILGSVLRTLIVSNPLVETGFEKQLATIGVLKTLAIVGSLLVLICYNCSRKRNGAHGQENVKKSL